LNTPVTYDYIIAGAGCAGLSLAVHMAASGKFAQKKILLIEKADKQQNDRTWCFWETVPGFFESVVKKKWNHAWIYNKDFSRRMDLYPYSYKLISGIDFYNYCKELLSKYSTIEWVDGEVSSIKNESNGATVTVANTVYKASYVFNSIPPARPALAENEYWLLQHFKGWVIETEQDFFDDKEATLMDFRTGQEHGTAFVYVMPFSGRQALVEYTLFTESLLTNEEYVAALKEYIRQQLKIDKYRIFEEEQGVIPMTNYRFPAVNGHIINIGTAGGQTKSSSGYTFQFIQKHSARIVENLVKKGNPFIPWPTGKRRFHFYDSVLLRILSEKKLPGDKIFTRLFKKNKPQQILRFLDNETSLKEELRIISSLPTMPFLKAAKKQW
jgi:lycopene beta-cyclase